MDIFDRLRLLYVSDIKENNPSNGILRTPRAFKRYGEFYKSKLLGLIELIPIKRKTVAKTTKGLEEDALHRELLSYFPAKSRTLLD
ncbi:hypothetical protein [Mesobacillus foraminis]|uniref:hypothetical protein n=1 Tax=Mesobacillus foraminis TaxID=279826 RepID=UPI000EF4A784|nr:hypothetical protein [Mesobacillus foraminis]